MARILINEGPYTLTLAWGSDVGVVTIGIVDGNGDEVVAAGTATTNTAGVYTYSLADQSTPTVLYATWSEDGGTGVRKSVVEVIGNRLFTVAEARAYTITGLQNPLSEAADYPTADIESWHDRIADNFESFAHRSFVRRYCRMELSGNGTYRLPLYDGEARTSVGDESGGRGRLQPRKLISVTVDGTAVADVKIDHGELVRTDGTWDWPTITDPFNVVVEYEYGDHPVLEEASQAALRMLVSNIVASDVPQGVVSWSNEDGSFQRDANGWAYPVKVHEFLKRHTRKTPIL